MTTFKDWWGLEIPTPLLRLGFKDRSWHNDAAASMMHPTKDVHGNQLQLWVGNEDTVLELGEGSMYMAGYVQLDEDGCYLAGEAPEAEELGLTFSTDDLPSFIQFVQAMLQAQTFEHDLHRIAQAVTS